MTSNFSSQTARSYRPFGMLMENRHGNSGDYRYGFNGMEKDDEVKGSGNSYDFGARIYDPRLGRWLSCDPMEAEYPSLSPYNFAANTPITAYDPDGRLIIFINGLWGYFGSINESGKNYWSYKDGVRGKWADNLMNEWDDKNALYFDGSLGGQLFIAANNFPAIRDAFGAGTGYLNAKIIIDNLSDGETIKFVTNSMGAAYQRGFSRGLMKYIEEEKSKNLQAQGTVMALIQRFERLMEGNGEIDLPVDISKEDLPLLIKEAKGKLEGLKSDLDKLKNIRIEMVVDIEPYQSTAKDENAENHYYIISDKSTSNFFEKTLDIQPVEGATDASRKSDGSPVATGHHASSAKPENLPKPETR